MLVFAGMEGDSAPIRAAKLKALQQYYRESDPRPLNMLGPSDMAKSNTNRGDKLVVNSHGNRGVFAGMDADQFVQELQTKGFVNGSFKAIYLMACNVGEQDQQGTIFNNFARDVYRIFVNQGIQIKVYAPRGLLTYKLDKKTKSGETYYEVTSMFIRTPERDYPLDEGVLLVQT